MAINPEIVVEDLEKYVGLFGIKLGKDAKVTFQDIEEFCFKCNYPSRIPLFFSKILRNSRELQRFFYGKGLNANLAALQLELNYYNTLSGDMNYQRGAVLYSFIHERSTHDNTAVLDLSLQHCTRADRNVLSNFDIMLAAFDVFEKRNSKQKESLEGTFLGKEPFKLWQVNGSFEDNLDISFNEIREYIEQINMNNRCCVLKEG